VLTEAGLRGAVVIVTGAGSGIGAVTGAVIPGDGGQAIDRE